MGSKILVILLLAGVTLAIYWPARHFDSVNLDDPLFIANPETPPGLNRHSFEWAMTGVTAANWHPVTSFSFLITHQLFGTNPGAEHLVNVVFHAANAVLLFLVLLRLTGAEWRSAAVAAIFAWHPLRVESVCWISERKDVLFAFFMLLSLLCYAGYARPGGTNIGRPEDAPRSKRSCAYILTLLFFVLGFMSKAMIVTLPFLFLLLDFWPLQRFSQLTARSLLVEKVPFFALTIFFCALTFWIQKTAGAVGSLEKFGMLGRWENATLSYVKYLGHFFWPSKLAVLYPYPKTFDGIQVLLAGLLLMAISTLCILQYSRRPYLAVGWFWYIGTMVPVIGLVQVGSAPIADRYTYAPLIGPVISMVWWVSEWAGASLLRKCLMACTAGSILAVCVLFTRAQMMVWQNSVALYEHTVKVTPANARAQRELGVGFQLEGRLELAAVRYRVAIAIDPERYQAHYLLAECLRLQGHRQEAIAEYEAAVSEGRNPDDESEDRELGIALTRLGRYQDAVVRFETALRVNPSFTDAMNDLSWLLATCPDDKVRDGTRAVGLAERACEQTDYEQPLYISTLAAAYAEAGRFDEAVTTAQRAVVLAQQQGETGLAQRNQRLLQLYTAHKACRANDE